MQHIQRHAKKCFLRKANTRGTGDTSHTYPLPWPHLQKPGQNLEPPWNRAAGLHLLQRVVKNLTGADFSTKDFLAGVEDSIAFYVQALTERNVEQLQSVMYPKLYHKVCQALSTLPASSQLLINIESIRQMKLRGVNSVVGSAESDDKHTISWLGQRVITSQRRLEDMLDSRKGGFNFELAREIGKEASMSKMEFLMSVTFSTKEKFAILDEDGTLLEGSNKFRDGFHLWRFGSDVLWDSNYPFEWKLLDINNHLYDDPQSEEI